MWHWGEIGLVFVAVLCVATAVFFWRKKKKGAQSKRTSFRKRKGTLQVGFETFWTTVRHVLAVFLAFFIVGGGLLFWHLHQKPLDLAFLLPQINRYFFADNSELRLTAQSIQLSAEVNRWGLFHVSAKNVSLLGINNHVVMELPAVRVSYGLQHILTFNYMPANVYVSDALLKLTLTPNGRLILQDQDPDEAAVLAQNATAQLAAGAPLATPIETPQEGTDKRPSVGDKTGKSSEVSTQTADSMGSTTQTQVETEVNGQDSVANTLAKDKTTSVTTTDIETAVVQEDAIIIRDLDQFMRYLLDFKRLALVDASIVVEDQKAGRRMVLPDVDFTMKRRRFSQYQLKFSTRLLMRDTKAMTFVLTADLNTNNRQAHFDLFFDRLNLSRAGRFADVFKGLDVLLQGKISGDFNFSRRSETLRKAVQNVSFTVKTLQEGTVRLPEPLDTSYPVRSIVAEGSFNDNLERLLIQPVKASLTTGLTADVEIQIDGIGSFLDTRNINDIKTTLKARMHNIPIGEVPEVWPVYLGPTAHQWVKENLKDGAATTAVFTLYFTGSEITDLLGDIDFDGVTVRYLDPMKPVTNAGGKVMLYPDKVEIFADRGTVGNLHLNVGNVYLTDLLNDVSNAKIELDVNGPISEALALLDSQPLDLISRFGIQPDKTAGQASGQVTLSFPLTEDLKAEDVQVDVTADIAQAVFFLPVDNLALQNGVFKLKVNNDALQVSGSGAVQGVPIQVKWNEYFSPALHKNVQSVYSVAGTVNEGLLGVYWKDISSYLRGLLAAEAVITKKSNGTVTVNAVADLRRAQLKIYPISYTKEEGVSAQLKTDLTVKKDGSLSSVKFGLQSNGGAVDITGSYVAEQGGWTLNLDNVKTVDSSFGGLFQLLPNKDLLVRLKGKSWNMIELKEAPFVKNSQPTTTVETQMPQEDVVPPNVTLDVSLDTLTMVAGLPLKNITLKGERLGSKWNKLFLFAEGRSATSINLTPATGKLDGLCNNVGDLLQRLGFSDQFGGGTAVLGATQLENGGFSGELTLKDLNIKEPGFIMQAVTILGILDAIRGKELTFSTGKIPFDLSPNFTLFIKDGVMYGTTLGITFSGRASTQALALNGSVIPAYAINSLPGRIPVIGTLFKGEQNGGLMGVKYDLTGTPVNPRVNFNTLSSIAPGILGRLFQ